MTFRSRDGFTLVELLIAVLLIDVGVLAMVAGTALIVRRQNAMRTRALAAQIAANRIQRLQGGACESLTGSATQSGITEQFSADAMANGLRDLRDSVSFTIDGAPRAVVIRSRMSC
jgi:Tfp pilus assembly protein PilV